LKPSEYLIKKITGELKGYEISQPLMELEDSDEDIEPIYEDVDKLITKSKYVTHLK